MTYEFIWEQVALRAMHDIPKDDRRRLRAAIRALANDPSPPNSNPLRGSSYHRMRLGEYRVLYRIEEERLAIHVVAVGRVPEH